MCSADLFSAGIISVELIIVCGTELKYAFLSILCLLVYKVLFVGSLQTSTPSVLLALIEF